MGNSINTNMAAFYAQGNINKASSNASSSIARLSSGNRIVKASDDVAALSVGTSLRTQVNTLRTALTNANQGTSLLQVADGAMAQVVDILQRQKSIATQASSGSLTSTERGFLNQEFQALTAQIDQISTSTNFNGVNLLGGGMGSKLRLMNTDALAAAFDPTAGTINATPSVAVASVVAIEAYDYTDPAVDKRLATGGIGTLDITDSLGAILAGAQYDNVNSSLGGKFTKFDITDVVYGVAAKISATIGGVTYSGTVANGGATAILGNGNTYLKLDIAGADDFTDAATVEGSKGVLAEGFARTTIMRTSLVQGVDFSGTKMSDVKGLAASGIASVRLSDPTRADIRNFRYAGNQGAVDTSILAVDINGSTFVSNGVADLIDGANTLITFEDGTGQAMTIDITGFNNAGAGGGTLTSQFTNIRTNEVDRDGLLNSLNIAFSKAGGGISFGVGSTAADKIDVSIKSAGSVNLFAGQSLNVNTAADANNAQTALDAALKTATAIRADIGGLQSRFNFTSSNLESSVQNQDAARATLLDTDVAAESTSFATSQVQLQAGISVLAQANLLTQNLLKLIG